MRRDLFLLIAFVPSLSSHAAPQNDKTSKVIDVTSKPFRCATYDKSPEKCSLSRFFGKPCEHMGNSRCRVAGFQGVNPQMLSEKGRLSVLPQPSPVAANVNTPASSASRSERSNRHSKVAMAVIYDPATDVAGRVVAPPPEPSKLSSHSSSATLPLSAAEPQTGTTQSRIRPLPASGAMPGSEPKVVSHAPFPLHIPLPSASSDSVPAFTASRQDARGLFANQTARGDKEVVEPPPATSQSLNDPHTLLTALPQDNLGSVRRAGQPRHRPHNFAAASPPTPSPEVVCSFVCRIFRLLG